MQMRFAATSVLLIASLCGFLWCDRSEYFFCQWTKSW